MKRLFLLASLTLLTMQVMALTPWKKGAFESGEYRNLLSEMGYKQADIDAKLQEVFNDVFRGPNKVYFEVGDSMGYVSDVKNHDARTEGMSYGMMIAVQFGEKDIFDRLWRWSKHYMQHKDGPRKGYFAWSCKTDGTRNAQGAASDGELYFITALIFASNRWGNDTGINYKAEAQYILDCIQPKEYEPEVRPGGFGAFGPQQPAANGQQPTAQKMYLIDPDTKLITFTPPTVSDSVSPTPAITFPPSTRCGPDGPTTGAATTGWSVPPRAVSSCIRPSTRRLALMLTTASMTAARCRRPASPA